MLIHIDSHYNELKSWRSWFKEERKYVADLTKLPDDRKKILNMGEFGTEGMFRRLELD